METFNKTIEKKDRLTHTFKNITFETFLKANFRKYFDPIYIGHNRVTELSRKFEHGCLIIYRAHHTTFLMNNFINIEKVRIDNKKKIFESNIISRYIQEKCVIMPGKDKENKLNLLYTQFYDVNWLIKLKKQGAFDKGCNIIEKIINNKEYC